MSEEQKPTAAAPKAAAQPAAAAPRPAAAAKPAAPAKPAVNELKPALVEPAALRAELERLRREEGMDFLLNLTGVDWMEEGLGAGRLAVHALRRHGARTASRLFGGGASRAGAAPVRARRRSSARDAGRVARRDGALRGGHEGSSRE